MVPLLGERQTALLEHIERMEHLRTRAEARTLLLVQLERTERTARLRIQAGVRSLLLVQERTGRMELRHTRAGARSPLLVPLLLALLPMVHRGTQAAVRNRQMAEQQGQRLEDS